MPVLGRRRRLINNILQLRVSSALVHKNAIPFSFYCIQFLQMLTNCYSCWRIVYRLWPNLQHTIIDLPVSPTYCCYTTLGKIFFQQKDSVSAYCAHQTIQLCSVKLRCSFLRDLMASEQSWIILIQLTIEYGAR